MSWNDAMPWRQSVTSCREMALASSLLHKAVYLEFVFLPSESPLVTTSLRSLSSPAMTLWHFYGTLHYITLSSFQTPLTPEVTSGASTIICYTKYNPPAQLVGMAPRHHAVNTDFFPNFAISGSRKDRMTDMTFIISTSTCLLLWWFGSRNSKSVK